MLDRIYAIYCESGEIGRWVRKVLDWGFCGVLGFLKLYTFTPEMEEFARSRFSLGFYTKLKTGDGRSAILPER